MDELNEELEDEEGEDEEGKKQSDVNENYVVGGPMLSSMVQSNSAVVIPNPNQ